MPHLVEEIGAAMLNARYSTLNARLAGAYLHARKMMAGRGRYAPTLPGLGLQFPSHRNRYAFGSIISPNANLGLRPTMGSVVPTSSC